MWIHWVSREFLDDERAGSKFLVIWQIFDDMEGSDLCIRVNFKVEEGSMFEEGN